MLKLLIILFQILLFAVSVDTAARASLADGDLKALYYQMEPSIGIIFEFKQVKNISVLSRPLISNGTVYVVDSETVNWYQTSPYAMMMSFTPNGMMECLDVCNGKISAGNSNPFAITLSNAFIGLLAGSPEQLEAFFNVDIEKNEHGSWELSMTPLDPMLSGVIKEITLQGDQYLRSVKIFEINGDNTLMKFSNHHERSDVEPETN
ncbi:MAG: outer membrane lipoprotein carrier protein LolA [Nitrosomonadaceae bacterium]|nr:outer membrane lipoprotein carrier protein LolA [Nitrosomonadaceae bacterium]